MFTKVKGAVRLPAESEEGDPPGDVIRLIERGRLHPEAGDALEDERREERDDEQDVPRRDGIRGACARHVAVHGATRAISMCTSFQQGARMIV